MLSNNVSKTKLEMHLYNYMKYYTSNSRNFSITLISNWMVVWKKYLVMLYISYIPKLVKII